MSKFLRIDCKINSREEVLSKIDNFFKNRDGFSNSIIHIISLNPEIVVLAQQSPKFLEIINESHVHIADGFWFMFFSRLLGLKIAERVTGVDLMGYLIEHYANTSIRIMFIGGGDGVADSLSRLYKVKFPSIKCRGIQGIKKFRKDILGKVIGGLEDEEQAIRREVFDFKPQIVFVSFGSPWQEMWIDRNKDIFNGAVVMGVGGAFDFLSGRVRRAPFIFRRFGFEWIFRLFMQPHRILRYGRLIKFIYLVLIYELGGRLFYGKRSCC